MAETPPRRLSAEESSARKKGRAHARKIEDALHHLEEELPFEIAEALEKVGGWYYQTGKADTYDFLDLIRLVEHGVQFLSSSARRGIYEGEFSRLHNPPAPPSSSSSEESSDEDEVKADPDPEPVVSVIRALEAVLLARSDTPPPIPPTPPADAAAIVPTCSVCLTESPNILFVKCGHACCCASCVESLDAKRVRNKRVVQCPLCREFGAVRGIFI